MTPGMSGADIAVRAEELCAAPAGCAFLLAVEESGLTLPAAAEPVAAAFLAALAVEAMSPWFGGHDRVVAMALAEGPRLLPLARDLLAQPAAAAWYAPLHRDAQQWVAPLAAGAALPAPVAPDRPPSGWECYAQKAEWGLWTSTRLDPRRQTSSFLASVAWGVDDLGHDFKPPLAAHRLTIAAAARVFEIAGPRDWHRLCAGFPAVGDDGRLVPDWAAAAKTWDGVHLSLGGLLASEQVRIDDDAGWSEHGAWDAEQTLWLRDVFDRVTPGPDILALAGPPEWLREPKALWIQPGPDTWPWLVSLGPGARPDPLSPDWPFPEDGPPPRLR